jgi:hypothetical protein
MPASIADFDAAGTLGVYYLRRYWSRKMAARTQCAEGAVPPPELVADNVLLAGLRLGIRETLAYLMTEAPSFEQFEAWVLAKNNGAIEPARVERLNGALRGGRSFFLDSIQKEPVLTPDDLQFWEENGYVIVKQAVPEEQCRPAVEAILEFARMDITRPDSWYESEIWIPLAHHPALWANRDSARIHTAFAQLWGRSDLWMNVDVCGVNPPERPGYRFRGSPLHWDMTLTPPIHFGTQAILYLTDTAVDQGCFGCVPGFHRRVESWLASLPAGADPRAQAVQELQALPIAGQAGDLIIWHQALPHGATPNRATLPRIVQYLNMFPSQYDVNADWS